MAELPRSRTAALSWLGRLEARVAVALALLVAGALGAMLLITIQLVSTQSRTRAEDELDAARSAFSSLMENRAASSIALTTLVTELPVFRAHLTDARLAEDRPTIDAMADGYRRQLDAHFVVVTNGDGTWLANPGLGRRRHAAARTACPAARGRAARDIRRRHRRSRRRTVPRSVCSGSLRRRGAGHADDRLPAHRRAWRRNWRDWRSARSC